MPYASPVLFTATVIVLDPVVSVPLVGVTLIQFALVVIDQVNDPIPVEFDIVNVVVPCVVPKSMLLTDVPS